MSEEERKREEKKGKRIYPSKHGLEIQRRRDETESETKRDNVGVCCCVRVCI